MHRGDNDWHIDEWCGAYPGRKIPNALVPYWDPQLVVEEIERIAKKGCHAISFCDNPAIKGYASIHNEAWTPMWKACADNDICINIQIGSGAQAPHASMESPIGAWIMTMPISIVNSAAVWLHLKALKDYPLKIVLSEGGIGWIPYFLERADFSFMQHHAWTHSDFGPGRVPSDAFREHFLTCFVATSSDWPMSTPSAKTISLMNAIIRIAIHFGPTFPNICGKRQASVRPSHREGDARQRDKPVQIRFLHADGRQGEVHGRCTARGPFKGSRLSRVRV